MIARVTILSTRALWGPKARKAVAKAKVTRAVKGVSIGQTFDLEFSAGRSPYRVAYSQGEDCLIFACRRVTGRYRTCNSHDGKARVVTSREGGQAASVSVSGRIVGLDSAISLYKAIELIEERLSGASASQQGRTVHSRVTDKLHASARRDASSGIARELPPSSQPVEGSHWTVPDIMPITILAELYRSRLCLG